MKNMTFGRAMGLIIFFVGFLLGVLGILMMLDTGSIFGFLMVAPTLVLLGLGMILFPGKKITLLEVNGDIPFKVILRDVNKRNERQTRQLQALGQAPLMHKIIWCIFSFCGIILTIVFLIN